MEAVNLFMTFEEFKHSLASWEKPLGKFVEGKTFQDIYKFMKQEYESGKKVSDDLPRSIPK